MACILGGMYLLEMGSKTVSEVPGLWRVLFIHARGVVSTQGFPYFVLLVQGPFPKSSTPSPDSF